MSLQNIHILNDQTKDKRLLSPYVLSVDKRAVAIFQTFDNISKLTSTPRYSESVNMNGFKWCFYISRVSSGTNDHLSLYVSCKPIEKVGFWTCNASTEYHFMSHTDSYPLFPPEYGGEPIFSQSSGDYGNPRFRTWADIMNPEKEIVNDDKIRVAVGIEIISFQCWSDFSIPHEKLTNVTLVVEEKELHVNTYVLAQQSPVFETLFFGEFAEKLQTKIKMHDVKHGEFVEFLNFFYHSNIHISKNNIAYILKMADQFDVEFLMRKCEKWLENSTDVSIIDLLNYAETYRFNYLQKITLDQLTTRKSIERVCKDYRKVSAGIAHILLEKLLQHRSCNDCQNS